MLTQQICGVERVDKVAFKKPNVGQVILKDLRGNTEILYIMAKVRVNFYLRCLLISTSSSITQPSYLYC